MLKTAEEIDAAETLNPAVVNGVDNANLLSVDSTEPIKLKVEKLDENRRLVEDEDEIGTEKEEKKEKESDKKEVKEKEEAAEEEDESENEDEEESEENPPEESYSEKVQKRIGTLTKKMRTAERERNLEREKRLELEKKLEEISKKTPATERPQKEDFDDEDEYIEALTDWKIDEKLRASQEKAVKSVEDEDEQKAIFEAYEDLDSAMERGRAKYKDFNEKTLSEDLVFSPEVSQIVLDTDIPEDIMYYLACNPDESEEISSFSEVKAAKEIGKIEFKLKAEAAKTTKKEKKAAQKKQSSAPDPITPVETSGTTEKSPENMTPKEYRAWRERNK